MNYSIFTDNVFLNIPQICILFQTGQHMTQIPCLYKQRMIFAIIFSVKDF
jgi:hypothetical protein